MASFEPVLNLIYFWDGLEKIISRSKNGDLQFPEDQEVYLAAMHKLRNKLQELKDKRDVQNRKDFLRRV